MIMLIGENNHLKQNKENNGIFRGLKIKLGHQVFEGLDFKLVNSYGMMIFIDENETYTNCIIFMIGKLN